jgi:hypothetical protein
MSLVEAVVAHHLDVTCGSSGRASSRCHLWKQWSRIISMSLVEAVVALVLFSIQANKMAVVVENYSQLQVRSVVQAEGLGESDIHRSLMSVYGRRKCLCDTTNS